MINKINVYRLKNQTISEDDLRAKIYELANENGGLINLAEKSNISHNTLWEQLNRNRGLLARVVPKIVNGSGNLGLMQLLGDRCDCMVIRKVPPAKGIRSIRKHELDLYSVLSKGTELIEEVLEDGIVTRNECREVNYHLNEIRRMVAELNLRICKAI